MIFVENLFKVYPDGTKALKGVSFSVAKGEFLGLMGPSGSGKSTLLHLIAGLEKPTTGRVFVEGIEITAMDEDQLSDFRKNNIAFIFQFYYLLEDFSVLENLTIVGELVGQKDPKKKALEILEFLRLSHRKNHKPYQLSGGEQQRTAIGRALMLEPKIILADEPTGNLDLEEGKKIFELFLELRRQRGITFIIATHNQEMKNYFDRILRLKDGVLED
ncbi:ABC transporter ATP-binding protein [Thermocrinis jamiesonii]|uniref:ABC transporter ATP-binding protein n=1 Tax=Thermocrinis jamiesonii TaxID=1302351 RepID=UPI0004959C79|nr:ABC transporter ATP-binding protein [Thermocrinis jamiesonii]